MLAPNTCLEYGFCDFVGQQGADPEDDPKNPDDPEIDPINQVKELKELLFKQKEINKMLQNLNKPFMKDTLLESFKQLARKGE